MKKDSSLSFVKLKIVCNILFKYEYKFVAIIIKWKVRLNEVKRVLQQNGSRQNGMEKMAHGQNGIGQYGMDKMVLMKWYCHLTPLGFLCVFITYL